MYSVYVTPDALSEIKNLPGHIRTQVRQQISALANSPRPTTSKQLEYDDTSRELRRLRIDRWRVIYAITEQDVVIDILAVRKRPPYDYGDLARLLTRLQ
jgi:mRNA interferase RelE/StbE